MYTLSKYDIIILMENNHLKLAEFKISVIQKKKSYFNTNLISKYFIPLAKVRFATNVKIKKPKNNLTEKVPIFLL